MSTTEQQETTNTPEVENAPKKRGRKPGKVRKGYFYEEEEEAFVKYITSEDQVERNKLFNEKLLPAFTKMIESIIRRYDLFTPQEDFKDTFYDTLSFLITKVNNFDVTKGYKVYSYCGTVCKNYLILKRTQTMKQRERMTQFDEAYMETRKDMVENSPIFKRNVNDEMIARMQTKLQSIVDGEVEFEEPLTENEIKVGYGLIELLSNWEDLFQKMGSDKFAKRTVNQSQPETAKASPAGSSERPSRLATPMAKVKSAPNQTRNITGFAHSTLGSSFKKLCLSASLTSCS